MSTKSTRGLQMTPPALNCDLGESYGTWRLGNDSAVMPLIDAANIACGFHAGDPSVIRETLALAKAHAVEIGAHVSYPDLQGFGRRSMHLRGQALTDTLHYQMAALEGMARTHQLTMTYVKPHGALYNDMTKDIALRADVMRAVAAWHRPIDLVVLATADDTNTIELATQYGLGLRFEAFADRAYNNKGLLVPREQPGAVLSLDEAVAQALAIANGRLTSIKGELLNLRADTLCVHGDTPAAVAMVQAIRLGLKKHVG